LAKSRVLIALDDWTGAMDELLEIIMRDKNGATTRRAKPLSPCWSC